MKAKPPELYFAYPAEQGWHRKDSMSTFNDSSVLRSDSCVDKTSRSVPTVTLSPGQVSGSPKTIKPRAAMTTHHGPHFPGRRHVCTMPTIPLLFVQRELTCRCFFRRSRASPTLFARSQSHRPTNWLRRGARNPEQFDNGASGSAFGENPDCEDAGQIRRHEGIVVGSCKLQVRAKCSVGAFVVRRS